MANICCVCGKKISSWAKEHPISEKYPQEFFCDTCFEKVKILQKSPVTNEMEFESANSYIDGYISSGNLKAEVCEVLENVKAGITENVIKAEELRKEREKYDYIMKTNGYNFEGYKITKYIDVVTAETVLGTGIASEFTSQFADLFGVKSEAFSSKLSEARKDAMDSVLKQVVKLEGNAIIGVDYNYHAFASNLIGVIISGTAVVIEKID